MPLDTRKKIVAPNELAKDGSPTVIALGRFDVLTADHCSTLAAAREGVERLIVVVEPDSDNDAMLLDESSRAQLAAALAVVDRVVICDRPAADALIAALEPVRVVDVESHVRRDIAADVLRRHTEQ